MKKPWLAISVASIALFCPAAFTPKLTAADTSWGVYCFYEHRWILTTADEGEALRATHQHQDGAGHTSAHFACNSWDDFCTKRLN